MNGVIDGKLILWSPEGKPTLEIPESSGPSSTEGSQSWTFTYEGLSDFSDAKNMRLYRIYRYYQSLPRKKKKAFKNRFL